LYFGYDDEKLTSRSLKQLSVVASILKSGGNKKIQIGGHADSLGEDRYNDTLSQKRARRVAEALRSLGVRGSQLNIEGFGERLPLSPNINPDGSDNP
ncbi:MAG: OmpA family protein, partial [Verrucomicrobiales bacterium]